jgi:hypothetical protein
VPPKNWKLNIGSVCAFARAAFYLGLAALSRTKSDLLTLLCVGSESHQLENSIAAASEPWPNVICE